MIAAGGTTDVTVALTPAANALQAGSYDTTIAFANTTDGDGNTVRDASLDIGAFNYSGPSMPINDSTTTSRSLNVPDSFEIADVEVTFEASHSYVGDLIFRISHNGTVVTLVDRPGTTGSGFGSSSDISGVYTFSDEGSVAWENLNDFPSGVYLPVQPLSAFDGGDAQGQWTLTVIDNAGSDIGEVSAWSIRLVPVPGQNCTGDIADDFGTTGADGQVSFGDFLALLGLIGPCPGGTPGCDGDFADDFGTLGADGQVSFGDFLALLGLIGPCP
jgi:subtilisin-like proprotein convertase family protein